MIPFVGFLKSSGRVVISGTSCNPENQETDELGIHLTDQVEDVLKVYVKAGQLRYMPEKPSHLHKFNYDTEQWEDPRSLADHQAKKWEEMKAKRTEVELSGFVWDGSTFDSDAVSQQKIQGEVLLASMAGSIPMEYSVIWTLQDNSSRTLSSEDMIAVGVAMRAHIYTCHIKSRDLFNQIYAANTIEEVSSIKWES